MELPAPRDDTKEQLAFLLGQLLHPDNNVILADEVMVTDADGIVRFVSDTYHSHFGVPQGYVEGKNIHDLAREGVFTPCVTEMVMERREKVDTVQFNKMHQAIQTTGIPVFDTAGKLLYVVCFNSMELRQLENLRDKYSALKTVLAKKDEEMEVLRRTLTRPTEMIIRSKSMTQLWENAVHIAPTKANILITGETGVGKSQLAREIHRISSHANGPFVEINCAAIPESLIESELFGYEKGAFTGADAKGRMGKIELANHGTLFLDEVGELSLSAQAKLLHTIQNKTLYRISGTKEIKVDFRLIAATNQDLPTEVAQSRFRSDLFYRLNVFSLNIPALRDRPEDILPLAAGFLEHFNREYEKNVAFSPALMEVLEQCAWPGNIRELENLVERIVVTSSGDMVDWDALPPQYRAAYGNPEIPPPGEGTLSEKLEALERQIITAAYRRLGTSTALARELGISQATAIRKIHKYAGEQGQ